jgi:hypothetical protein
VGGLFIDWAAGVALVYATLFGIGHALLGSGLTALVCFGIAAAAVTLLTRRTARAAERILR